MMAERATRARFMPIGLILMTKRWAKTAMPPPSAAKTSADDEVRDVRLPTTVSTKRSTNLSTGVSKMRTDVDESLRLPEEMVQHLQHKQSAINAPCTTCSAWIPRNIHGIALEPKRIAGISMTS